MTFRFANPVLYYQKLLLFPSSGTMLEGSPFHGLPLYDYSHEILLVPYRKGLVQIFNRSLNLAQERVQFYTGAVVANYIQQFIQPPVIPPLAPIVIEDAVATPPVVIIATPPPLAPITVEDATTIIPPSKRYGAKNSYYFQRVFKIGPSTQSKLIKRLVPLMLPCLYTISIKNVDFTKLHNCDCTDVRINRVHPYQFEWYRSDLGFHTFTIQLLVDSCRNIRNVMLGRGHNNDSGIAMLTGLNEFVKEMDHRIGFNVLGDSVYRSDIYTTPSSINPLIGKGEEVAPKDEKTIVKSRFHTIQAAKRSVVENEFSLLKGRYQLISNRGIFEPVFLSYIIIMIFHIEQMYRESQINNNNN
ncbi:hypothetical protein ACTA71_000157 [Dictyostelium dimigraforme]